MSMFEALKACNSSVLEAIIRKSTSKRDVIRRFGFKGNDTRALRYVVEFIKEREIDTTHFSASKTNKYNEEDVKIAVQNSKCVTDVLRELNLSPVGGNLQTIKKIINANNLDISHFDVKNSRRRNKTDSLLQEVLGRLKKDNFIHRSTLRFWILKFGLVEYRCSSCGIEEWKGQPIVLDLDHKDGNRDNNSLENLHFLCPNCHSLTTTFRGRNNARGS